MPGVIKTAASSARERPMPESKERITRVTLEQAKRMKGETDYARIDAMTDEDIAKAVAEDPDAAPLDIDWSKAKLVLPPGKENVTLRVDRDVLAWFRGDRQRISHAHERCLARLYGREQAAAALTSIALRTRRRRRP
jgi:uncharacterized protein (DUF4415 family)